jgi:phage terminase large subunit
MNIVFSEKYEPLFNLLEARNVVKSKDFKEVYSTEEQKYWLDLSQVDTVLLSGGRDSGETFALSCFNPIAAKDYNHRILYTRQTMSSTDNSITEALESRMEMLGIAQDFESSNKIYTLKDPEKIGKISITGQKTSVGTQTAKLKSLEDFSIFETDEGEELESFDSWMKTKRSMRAQDVQCLSIILFNPPTKEHWLHEAFYEEIEEGFNGVKGKVLYIHTTYLDNGKENMAEHNWLEYEELRLSYEEYLSTPKLEREYLPNKLVKKYKQYKFDILGGFKDVADGVIYEDWEYGEFDNSLPYIYGLDFGSNDPDALTRVAVDRDRMLIYVEEMYFKNNTSFEALKRILEDRVGFTDLIVADSAERRMINDLWDSGINIKRCKKGQDSVRHRIKTIQGYTIIVAPDSPNVAKALNNYVWHDSKSGVPKHDWSDLLDGMGYAAMDIIEF